VRAIAAGEYEAAYLIARGPNPLASMCGRVCGAPCEAACRRGSIDQPIAIRALKRFVADQFWDSTRGPGIMEATGRETTKRAGQVFPAQGQYSAGKWAVTMQLPDLPPGTPVAVAIWNGSQQDRDGRKYFSVWQPLR